MLTDLPNLLTLSRIAAIPVLVALIAIRTPTANFLACIVFSAAAITDYLDGYLARGRRQISDIGRMLDPIADKLLLSTLFLVLTHMNLVPRYVTVLVFSRDFGILLISTLLFATGTLRDFRPSLLGKLNTVVQIFGLTVVLVAQVWPSVNAVLLRVALLKAIAYLAPLSAAQYAWIVFRRVSSPEPQAI